MIPKRYRDNPFYTLLFAREWDAPSLTEKNYWADNRYYSDLEVNIYDQ